MAESEEVINIKIVALWILFS